VGGPTFKIIGQPNTFAVSLVTCTSIAIFFIRVTGAHRLLILSSPMPIEDSELTASGLDKYGVLGSWFP
jgi:hypothetical protein